MCDLPKLSAKQQNYVDARARGLDLISAYRNAYNTSASDKVCRNEAYKLEKHPKIKQWLDFVLQNKKEVFAENFKNSNYLADFLDAENNEVDEGKETSVVIRECKADGTLVKETWARVFDNWYKNNPTDVIWWKDTPDGVGEWLFSFDKKTVFNMFADYPKALTPEQKQIFDKENPEWADFFKDRQEGNIK